MDSNKKIQDVVVVGAGISGTYAAWKLGQCNPNWNIQILEAQYRSGGRLHSVTIPGISDFKADLGAMRFRHEDHPRLARLISDLNLKTKLFTTPTEDDTLYYLRDKLLTKSDIESGNVPYSMTEEERKLSHDTMELQEYWNKQVLQKKYLNNNSNKVVKNVKRLLCVNGESTDYYQDDDRYHKLCRDNQPTYKKGVMNAWYEVASPDALEYLAYRDLHCSDMFVNTNFGEYSETEAQTGACYKFLPHTLYMKRHKKRQLHTIVDGFQELVDTMMQSFKDGSNHELHLNHTLESVHYDDKGKAHLTFMDAVSKQTLPSEVVADAVILAIPAEALKHVRFTNDDVRLEMARLQPSVSGSPAMKTFLAYDSAWWRKDGRGPAFKGLTQDLKQIGTDLACGTLLDIGTDSKTGKSLLVAYSESEKQMQFWKPLQDPTNQLTPTAYHLDEINKILAKIFNIPVLELPKPYFSVCKIWHEAPIWAGWHNTVAGYDYPKCREGIQKLVQDKELYIVGESYSDVHGWCEGALETTQQVLHSHFNVVQDFE